MAHHVHDAQLNHCLGKHGLNSLGEALETIDAGDEDVLHARLGRVRIFV